MARNGYLRVVSDDFVRRYVGLFEYTTHDILTASSFLGLEQIVTKMGLNHQTIGHLTNRNDNINDCSSHKLEFCRRLIYFAAYGFLEFYSQNFGGRKSNGPCLEISQQRSYEKKNRDSGKIKRPVWMGSWDFASPVLNCVYWSSRGRLDLWCLIPTLAWISLHVGWRFKPH